LVELADEYERNAARDIQAELSDEELTRRQRVAVEDAEGTMRMSRIGDDERSTINFRHLAMLAQVRDDGEILQIIGDKSSDRLSRMRSWINGPYFPEELRISVLHEPTGNLDSEITAVLSQAFTDCTWDSKSIAEAISSSFKSNEINAKEGYMTLYLAILGSEKGPRLAPILAELERSHVLKLLG
jgi:lysyl-tRNA synthetase class 1